MFENCQQYYTGLISLIHGNPYLEIYKAILILKNSATEDHDAIQTLQRVKRLQGFELCWGPAKDVIERPTTDSIEALEYYYLTILPAYVPFVPQAKRSENQQIVQYLLNRSNKYKRISSPKFYSYDRVINILCETDTVVTVENCKKFKGVGPKIATHIKNFILGIESSSHLSIAPPARRTVNPIAKLAQFREYFKRPRVKPLNRLSKKFA